MRTTLLSCGLTKEENARLLPLCQRIGAELREVRPGEYGCSLNRLLAGETSLLGCPDFREGMLVMCGFTSAQMDMLLAQTRTVPLKAVLTPINQGWTVNQLHAELAKEREALRRK